VSAGLAAVVAFLAHRAEPFLRDQIVAGLEERFHARVELDSFHVSLHSGIGGQWGVWAVGTGLRIWPPAQGNVPEPTGVAAAGPVTPLIRLEEFRFHTPLRYEPDKPFHIAVVQLKGLDVDLPPRSHMEHDPAERPKTDAKAPRFGVDGVECSGARLTLETSKPGKLPTEIEIAHFKLTKTGSGGATGAIAFSAELTNPRPVGTIHTTGSFGALPWADLGESPIMGDYQFDHADLSDFKEIAGILSSTGHYVGTLRNLIVDGETDTPDFRLRPFDNPLALHTKFHAKVDGTNGDTWLQPVEAMLGHSHFTAQGQVVRVVTTRPDGVQQSGGHNIALKVDVDRARVEDFLRLASHSGAPLLTGAVTAKAALHIPPGKAPVHERIGLKGSFVLDQARFASERIQKGIEQLSLRGQGRPRDVKTTDPASVDSTMKGDFQMAGGVITLPSLTYTVPGATIQLKGAYGVVGGTLDFDGTAKMDATVSDMVGGWKGLLLKPLDRHFEKDGAGTEIPIHIEGTREHPEFGLSLGHMKASSSD